MEFTTNQSRNPSGNGTPSPVDCAETATSDITTAVRPRIPTSLRCIDAPPERVIAKCQNIAEWLTISPNQPQRKPQDDKDHKRDRPYTVSIVTFFSTTSLFGLFWRFCGTRVIFSATSSPSTTSPKMVCLPVSQVVGTVVMKNCDPLVFGPEFAMASLPGLSNLCGDPLVSSSN